MSNRVIKEPKFTITKDIHLSYGHRVWTQELDPEFALDNSCVCKHLHGHSGTITVGLSSEKVTDGFVTDFKHLNWLKQAVDTHLDHKFIIDKNDPLYMYLVGCAGYEKQPCMLNEKEFFGGAYSLVSPFALNNSLTEFVESFTVVNFVPTSENLAKWIFEIVEKKMERLATVDFVTWKETEKTSATYS